MESQSFPFYSHNTMKDELVDLTENQLNELRAFYVERYVDNMETKDLVEYVTDDLDRYYDKMDDKQFLDEASDYWEDHFSDVVDEVEEYAKCDFKKDIRDVYLESLSEGKDLDDYGSKVDALVDSMGVTAEEESTTHRRRDLDSL